MGVPRPADTPGTSAPGNRTTVGRFSSTCAEWKERELILFPFLTLAPANLATEEVTIEQATADIDRPLWIVLHAVYRIVSSVHTREDSGWQINTLCGVRLKYDGEPLRRIPKGAA